MLPLTGRKLDVLFKRQGVSTSVCESFFLVLSYLSCYQPG